ncbi:urea carboxylase-associated family protein [Bradyrhizobium prioriisuperbiae]|uniref:urea carboxylase-associated family protein n=1 Tax=Bradyrhizobium prioriisuperbiae TaxID=2854389 RepID=UPI0028EB70D8|nr:urea carboxylase-associated family protein [Bradyrhizobium prioritasuperba]
MNQRVTIDASRAILIPARHGIAARLRAGQSVSVLNTYGKQVVDTWAFNASDMTEFMSMEHSRAAMLRLTPQIGDTLVTNRRRAILTVVADTTPGVHDTLIAACDIHRYRQLGAVGHHDSCTDNLAAALDALGLAAPETPAPLNLFMNVPVADDGTLRFQPPVSEPGQYITLRADMDLVIVFSACPQDMVPVNDMKPTDAHFLIT